MNKIFKRLRSTAKERAFSVASEYRTATIAGVFILAILSFIPAGYTLDSGTLPTGDTITSGSGSIATAGRQMTVTQSTNKMIASWETFNIGRLAGVTFNQPGKDSVALNKIYDQSPSRILGSLSANGNIYLINPSGIIFGEGAQVNVGGLVASSLNISDADFNAGKYIFSSTGTAGDVINKGSINANGGVVALLAPKAINEGSITANGGSVILGAGNQVTLDFQGDGLITYTIDQGAVDALASNKGLIKADGGLVVMTAEAANNLTSAVVNNKGVIEAQALGNKSGKIMLMSDMENGTTVVDGTLDASAPNGGDGGFIETSAKQVTINDGVKITTTAPYGTSGNWLIDPYDFTIAASGGDITGDALTAALNGGNVTIQTLNTGVLCEGAACGNGTAAGNGDIHVNDVVACYHTLTLSAYRNVNINDDIVVFGDVGLVITPNTGGKGGSYYLNNGAMITFTGWNPSLTIAGNAYTLISDITGLQGMNGNLAGYYAIAMDLDASLTSGWNSGAGFVPVGNVDTPFTGKFEGLGHDISNLTINRPTESYVGLFGVIGKKSSISNVNLINVSVEGLDEVGSLVGYNYGKINYINVTGNVNGSNYVGGLVGCNHKKGLITNSSVASEVSGAEYSTGGLAGTNAGTIAESYASGNVGGSYGVGGLIGSNQGTITESYATGKVAGAYRVGGLVGAIFKGTIDNSFATGNVTGNIDEIGGLVGGTIKGGSITNSYATGIVTGTDGSDSVGGLVGYFMKGTIADCYATGNVIAAGDSDYVGGLVGYFLGKMRNAYAEGNVTGNDDRVGGLIGYVAKGKINNVFATGDVSSIQWSVGGLIGRLEKGTVMNAYATGNVTGDGSVGGLVGRNYGKLINTYSVGLINGSDDYVGGLVGENYGKITGSYWNTTTSGTFTGIGGGTVTTGATGLATAQMRQQASFVNWDFVNIWKIIEGVTYPTLR